MISPPTSYRLDNCRCARRAKDNDEHQVALHRRKNTTKRSQCREHDQLPHLRVHLQDTFHFAPILEAPRPANTSQRDGPRLATTHPPSPRAPWPKTTLKQKMRAFDDEVAIAVAQLYLVHMLQSTLPAGFIAPCLPTKTDKLPSGSQWLHEIKHDGFRIIARKKGAQMRLYSRPGNDLTSRFPLIVETLARLRSRSCIIDGEAVACDDNGVASFDLVRHHRAN